MNLAAHTLTVAAELSWKRESLSGASLRPQRRHRRRSAHSCSSARRPASIHVSNIMAKLGATGRGEAVAVARQRGLLD